VIAHSPGSRLVQGAHQMQQRGLADPTGRSTATSSPAATARLTWSSARTGGDPGYTFDTLLQLQHRHPPRRPARARVVPAAVTTPATTTRCRASAPRSPAPARRRHRRSRAVTGTQRRVFPARRPPRRTRPSDWATSAVTGTASTRRGLLRW
jgi:hypothetical protein